MFKEKEHSTKNQLKTTRELTRDAILNKTKQTNKTKKNITKNPLHTHHHYHHLHPTPPFCRASNQLLHYIYREIHAYI